MANAQIDEKELARLRALDVKETERKMKERRYWAEQAIILQKARKQGIVATDAEVDAYIKTMRTKNKR